MKKFLFIFLFFCSTCFAAVTFDNVDDYVDANYAPNYGASDDFTVCAWATYTSASTSESYIVGDYITDSTAVLQLGFAPNAYFGTPKKLFAVIRDDSNHQDALQSSGTDVVYGALNHICITYKDSTTTGVLYLNGVADYTNASLTATAAKNFSSRNFSIGARNFKGTQDSFYNGTIYEVAFWTSALTSGNITTLYNAGNYQPGIPLSVATTLAYWKMNNGYNSKSADGASFLDSSGNSHTGTGNDGANNTGLTWVINAIGAFFKLL